MNPNDNGTGNVQLTPSPSVGVVIPHYNQQHLLPQLLESLRSQEMASRIVVIDDCSTLPVEAPTADRVFRFTSHSGVQAARNAGRHLLNWEGLRYILFSDADIVWLPGALKLLVTALDACPSDVAYAYCDYQREGLLRETYKAGPFDPDRLRSNSFISTMSLIRASHLPEPAFVEDEERLQDWSLWLRLLNLGYVGTYVPRVLFRAIYEEGCISSRANFDCWKQEIQRRYVS